MVNQTTLDELDRILREADERYRRIRMRGLGPFGCRCMTLAERLTGDGCDICQPATPAPPGADSEIHREDNS